MKVGLSACSNGHYKEWAPQIYLGKGGLQVFKDSFA